MHILSLEEAWNGFIPRMEREKDNVVYKRRGRFLELKKASPCAKESISWK